LHDLSYHRGVLPSGKRIKRRGKDRFEPRKTYVNGKPFWQVNLPSQLEMRDGHQVRVQKRKTFKNREEAQTAAEQARVMAKNNGVRAFAIPEDLRTDALAAARVLQPLNATLLEAVKFYADHLRQIRTSQKVSVVIKELLGAKEHDNLRPRYLKDLRVRLNRFAESFGDRTISEISGGEINAWLRGFKPFNRNTFRLRISTLFSYSIERKWCQSNPVEEVQKVKASAAIGLLMPEEFAKLLEAASERTLPYWLIGGFAGLRRAEIERLEWHDVHFESGRIEVPALKAKTASRRLIQMQPNLAAWLEPYKGWTGHMCPPNLRKLLEEDRRRAGLRKWPPNALRHSFASYHLAAFDNAAKLALELGHTSEELIFRHYRELVRPEQAAKYWAIRPVGPPSNRRAFLNQSLPPH
jgi:integrase